MRHLLKLVQECETNEKRAETECQNLRQQLQCMQQKQAQETEMKNYIGKSKDSLCKGNAMHTWMNYPFEDNFISVSVDVYGIKEAVTEIRHLTFDLKRIMQWNMSIAAKQVWLQLLPHDGSS